MPKKILVAEDEKALANALALKLKHAGFDSHIASNGEEVLEFLKKDHFDLLLLDIIIPIFNCFKLF